MALGKYMLCAVANVDKYRTCEGVLIAVAWVYLFGLVGITTHADP